jgi:uncharacterized membrane protein
MAALARLILAGALAVLPLLITVYVALWLLRLVEAFFGAPIKWLLGEDGYATGMGFALAALVCIGVGLLMRTPPFLRLYRSGESLLMSLPLVKSIYGPLRDFIGLFGTRKGDELLQVVQIDVPGTRMRMLGFVTRTEFSDVPDALGDDRDVAVYLPMSYQVGGYTVFLPKKEVTPVEMSREEAMRFILMAGVKSATGEAAPERRPGFPARVLPKTD